jgi:hypothetical protein
MFVIILYEQSSLDIEHASYGIGQISQKHDLLHEIFFYNSRFFHDIYVSGKGNFVTSLILYIVLEQLLFNWYIYLLFVN